MTHLCLLIHGIGANCLILCGLINDSTLPRGFVCVFFRLLSASFRLPASWASKSVEMQPVVLVIKLRVSFRFEELMHAAPPPPPAWGVVGVGNINLKSVYLV